MGLYESGVERPVGLNEGGKRSSHRRRQDGRVSSQDREHPGIDPRYRAELRSGNSPSEPELPPRRPDLVLEGGELRSLPGLLGPRRLLDDLPAPERARHGQSVNGIGGSVRGEHGGRFPTPSGLRGRG